MNENDFRKRYAAQQEKTQVSENLKQRTLALAEDSLPTAEKTPACEQYHSQTRRPAPRKRTTPPSSAGFAVLPRKRWILAAAACLVTGALIIGGLPFLSTLPASNNAPVGIALDEAEQRSGFLVRAYASDNTTTILPGENGMIVFDRSWEASGSSGNAMDPATSLFTGCVFRVEGDDIARVQMNVSAGELYRQDIEHLTQTDDPERWHEATTWKSTKRGLDDFYRDYDIVHPHAEAGLSGKFEEGADNPVQVQLLKRYGATVEVNTLEDAALASGETSFGLYLSLEGIDDSIQQNSDGTFTDQSSRALDQIKGEHLTITVTFADGRTSTQVIELHTAYFQAQRVNDEINITPELIPSDVQVEYQDYIYSVYGVVTDINEQAFPVPLDHAKEVADEVIPAPTLGRSSETYRVKVSYDDNAADAVLDQSMILSTDQTGEIMSKTESPSTLTVSSSTVTRSSTPPRNTALSDFSFIAGFSGDTAYANKCSEEVFGYHFNEDGTLTSDNHCFLTASFDLTNNSPEPQEFDLVDIGDYAIIDDDESHWSTVHTSYEILNQVSENTELDEHGRYATIAAGETVRVSKTLVVPNWIADNPTLMHVAGTSPDSKPVLFSVADQV